MKSTLSIALLSIASSVYSSPLFARSSCTICSGFTISASGGVNGVLGQLGDGQNRVYGNLPHGTYTLGCNGGITDAKGRGCILTPPTTQFQCDVGAAPTTGFSISSSGQILHDGSGTFYACPTGDNGAYNIYSTTLKGQPKCVTVTLTANGCAAPPATVCGYDLTKTFEYPHLIVPVDSSSPDTAYGTQYNGKVTGTVSSIFNFDIPSSDAGKTCSLVFLFPQQKDLQTSSFTFSGAGDIDFAKLSSTASQATTYANAPSVEKDYGITKVGPGGQYTIATFPCPANSAISFKLSSSDTSLDYFQDYNPSPIGLYITVC